jgi:hypothetical protein
LRTQGQILKDAHHALDDAVARAYGIRDGVNPLEYLLQLNHNAFEAERKGENVMGPGVPTTYERPETNLITKDSIRP